MDNATTIAQDISQINWQTASDEEILAADLIIALGLESLSDDDKAVLADRMITTVQKAVAVRVYKELPEHLQLTLKQLLEGDNGDKLNDFLVQHVPNFADYVREEMIKFKRAMLTQPQQNAAPAAA